MKIRIFDPVGIKADDYRHRYPEIDRTPEFTDLSSRILIFIWWYANATSPLVLDIMDDYQRVAEALKQSGFNPNKVEKENILRLQFDTPMAVAIKKMASFDPGIRFRSYKIVRTVFNEYEKLIKRGPVNVPETSEEGEVVIEKGADKSPYFVDRYVITSSRIVEALPNLIAKLEEGFGIVDITGEQKDEDGGISSLRDWHMGKENN